MTTPYHDLQAILDGRGSCHVTEWPLIRKELTSLLQDLAALQTERDRLNTEVQHWREAAQAVDETDGHGWAATTNGLREELASTQGELETTVASHKRERLKLQAIESENATLREQVARLEAVFRREPLIDSLRCQADGSLSLKVEARHPIVGVIAVAMANMLGQ